MFAIGARRGECLAVRWRDIDWNEKGNARFVPSLTETRDGKDFKTPKNGKFRQVELGEVLLAELKLHRVQQAKDRLAVGIGYAAGDFGFARRNGEPYSPRAFGDAFRALAVSKGFREFVATAAPEIRRFRNEGFSMRQIAASLKELTFQRAGTAYGRLFKSKRITGRGLQAYRILELLSVSNGKVIELPHNARCPGHPLRRFREPLGASRARSPVEGGSASRSISLWLKTR
jgi:integrase